ncbi:hypothetical protein [Anabaena sp. PCC 7108]|uniref:hypothetical protein n=1 Tax=Anabaena sp. PCC 7108 TaxID=163908 RepID=UPI0003456F49|nr:hypothetical protein [Anabaena sp. PCC 7108]
MKLSRILPLVVGGAVTGIVVSSASPANALIFNFNGVDYDVTTVTGSYTTFQSQIQNSPWWGSANNDTNFINFLTNVVGNSFGYPIPLGTLGISGTLDHAPAFATSFNGVSVSGSALAADGFIDDFNFSPNQSVVYAVGTASVTVPFDTPGGATIATVGSLFALGLMRKAKKRLAAKKLVVNPVETVV